MKIIPNSTIDVEKQNSDAHNEAEKWNVLQSTKTARKCLGVTAIDEKIYIAGGWHENDDELSSAGSCRKSKYFPISFSISFFQAKIYIEQYN